MLSHRRDRNHDTATGGRACAAPRKWESALPAPAPVDERGKERELLGQVREHRLERALDPARPGAARIPRIARLAPRRELRRDRLLYRFAVCEERRATRA